MTGALLRGSLGGLLNRDDLAGHPDLTELWLLQSGGSWPPTAAAGLRRDRGCPRRGAAIAAGRRGAAAPAVARWLSAGRPDGAAWRASPILSGARRARLVRGASSRPSRPTAPSTVHGSGCAQLAGHPILEMLPELQAAPVRNAVRVLPLLHQASSEGRHGNAAVFRRPVRRVRDDRRRTPAACWNANCPALLAQADPLDEALRGCPNDLAAAFGRELDDRLSPAHPDPALARRFSPRAAVPTCSPSRLSAERLAAALEQVSQWSRRTSAFWPRAWATIPSWRSRSGSGARRTDPGGAAGSAAEAAAGNGEVTGNRADASPDSCCSSSARAALPGLHRLLRCRSPRHRGLRRLRPRHAGAYLLGLGRVLASRAPRRPVRPRAEAAR